MHRIRSNYGHNNLQILFSCKSDVGIDMLWLFSVSVIIIGTVLICPFPSLVSWRLGRSLRYKVNLLRSKPSIIRQSRRPSSIKHA